MQIPTFSTPEEKKAWWIANAEAMAQQSIENKQELKQIQKRLSSIPIPANVRVVYLRVGTKPVGCFVTKLTVNADGSRMDYQFSAYNPKDRYNRHEGKRIALERLESHPYSIIGLGPNVTPYQLKFAATETLAGIDPIRFPLVNGEAIQTPVRISHAAQEWIEFRLNLELAESAGKELSEGATQ